MQKHNEYLRRLQARLTEIADERELEAIAQGKPVSKTVAEIRALVEESGECREREEYEDAPPLTAAAAITTNHPSYESGGEISQPLSNKVAPDGRPADWPASWHPITAGEIAETLIAEIRNALIPARHACRKQNLQIDVPMVLTAIDRTLEMTTVCAERLYDDKTRRAEHVRRDIWRQEGSYETHEARKRDLAAALGIAEGSTDWVAMIYRVMHLRDHTRAPDSK